MARMVRDGHLGFARLREIDPPKTPRISGRYLDRWVGVWENACNDPDAFQRMARDLGEFWLLDQWFTVGIRGYVQSTAGMWLNDGPVSFLESAIFHASYARHPDHVRNLELKRADLYRRLCGAVRGAPPEAMTRLGARAAVYRADLADANSAGHRHHPPGDPFLESVDQRDDHHGAEQDLPYDDDRERPQPVRRTPLADDVRHGHDTESAVASRTVRDRQ